MVDPSVTEWLLRVGAGLGILCLFQAVAVITLYRDNNKLRVKNEELAEKRTAEAILTIKTLGEITKGFQANTDLAKTMMNELRTLMDEFRNALTHNRARR